jgi:hypothetical protein
MIYSGVDHFYVYDTYQKPAEKLDHRWWKQFGDIITYVDWSEHQALGKTGGFSPSATQNAAYQHMLDHNGDQVHWVTMHDMDEYPFSLIDTDPMFLRRAVEKMETRFPNAVELGMQNVLFLGQPKTSVEKTRIIDQLKRRDRNPVSNSLSKPIVKPPGVSRARVHHNVLCEGGISSDFPLEELRMNHYWGSRLQNWTADTPESLATSMDNAQASAIGVISKALGTIDDIPETRRDTREARA